MWVMAWWMWRSVSSIRSPAHIQQGAVAARAHVRWDRAIDSLGTEHVDVEQVCDVSRGEGFDIADDQVSGVVNDDIQQPSLRQDGRDGIARRIAWTGRLERWSAQREVLGDGHSRYRFGGLGIAVTHAGVDGMSNVGERAGGRPDCDAGSAPMFRKVDIMPLLLQSPGGMSRRKIFPSFSVCRRRLRGQ
nr:hypothetical protein [Bordetella genomosp. 10]